MSIITTQHELIVSEMAENLVGSEIIKLGAEINERIRKGEKIYNYTIGDFAPKVFPIPDELTEEIIKAYKEKHTNYPAANGILELRKAVSSFLYDYLNLNYTSDEILITSGARPAIYAAYTTLINPGDKIIFPVPSWNNNHYTHLSSGNAVMIETQAENNFMPTAEDIRPHVMDAAMIALCSPLNPTGTTFTKKGLEEICDLVIEENMHRGHGEKPLYLLFDQIYWVLCYGETQHYNPVSLRPEMRNYTICIDGLSKSFAATGVRVGWTFGPQRIMDKMKAILSHIGAWAPKAEQVAASRYLIQKENVSSFLNHFKKEIDDRLQCFYNGIQSLKTQGHPVDAIAPQAALYLTLRFDLKGKSKQNGETIETTEDITSYLLEKAGLALVPFYAFGSSHESTWYRLSVGTCTRKEIDEALDKLKVALEKLS